jgi:membrane protease YdiL (CAAX protease family)
MAALKRAVVEPYPVLFYFALTFAISWLGAFLVVAPRLGRGEPVPRLSGVLMFPVMLLGPSIAGIALTRILDGDRGIQALFSRMRRIRLPLRWYAVLLIPPALILLVLVCMTNFVSAVFAPASFFKGMAFGVPAGLFEEIGWTGYAFPKMSRKTSALAASIQLGLLWSIWHFPVIDFLGTASPHGRYLAAYFLAFTATMTAIRVLIAWSYVNTESLWLAQLLHISSTGSLVALSPARVNSEQEALWYAVYALGLWSVVAILAQLFGMRLRREVSG